MTILLGVLALVFTTLFIIAMLDYRMDDGFTMFLGVIALVSWVLFVLSNVVQKQESDPYYQSREDLDTRVEICESQLRRDQHCILVAVPAKPR